MLLADMVLHNISVMIFLLIVAVSLWVAIKTKDKGLYLYDSYFIGLIIYTCGCIVLSFSHYNESVKILLELSIILLLVSFVLWFCNRVLMKNGVKLSEISRIKSSNTSFAWISFGLLLLINIVFIYFVYDRIIKSHLGGVFALLDIRKTIASGEAGYFAPGLIKQIRDIFAPAFLSWLVLFYTHKNRNFLISILLLTILTSMIIGGQRMPILVLFLTISISYYIKFKLQGRKLNKFAIITLASSPLVLMFFLNIFLGRANQESGVLIATLDLFINLTERILTTVPKENSELITYIIGLEINPFSLWLSDLSILLPGTQESFSNELHSILGGSSQGNAVLGVPLDIYINAGYIGIVLVPVIICIALYLIQVMLMNNKNPVAISLFIVLFLYLPFCYSFYLFLLNGGLVVIAYSIYDIFVPRKRHV